MNQTFKIVTTLTLMGFFAGCADTSSLGDVEEPHAALSGVKADQWSIKDSPSLFSADLEYRIAELPKDGEATNIPWTGSYWPVFEDSINVSWAGSEKPSAAQKYGNAFGVTDIEDRVSSRYGIDAWSERKACTKDADCKEDGATDACAKRRGADSGYCIPTWWGICHAWAPVAIMEPEPVHPVVRNGVTFEVNDLKALLTLAYDRVTSKFLSLRCNESNSAGEIDFDEYGNPRVGDAACKDTNAGTFHVIIANYLGIKGLAFVEDRTFDVEVWNQPVRSFRVNHMEEVSSQKANELAGAGSGLVEGGSQTVSGNVEESTWYHHEQTFTVPAGGRLTATMSAEGDADLYLRAGAQATEEDWDCRPWLGAGKDEACELAFDDATEVHLSVFGYTTTDFEVKLETFDNATSEYIWNDEAETFYYVQTELKYIGESATTLDGNLSANIDTYTHTDVYEYILEVDGEGKINGGEWVGSSKTAHPDFLWLPTGRQNTPIAGGSISYEIIKSMLDESLSGPPSATSGDVVTVRESGKVEHKEWAHFGPYAATTGAFEAVITGTGDADLYVREGNKPTTGSYDCRPYNDGSSESCTLEAPGDFYVSIRGYKASEFDLAITYRTGDAGAPVAGGVDGAPAAPAHLDVSGHVATEAMDFYELDVVAGQGVVVTSTADADIDLYVKMGQKPTTTSYDERAYTTEGNETLKFTPAVSGKLFIGVHGYNASDYTLVTTDG